ncbi:MAG TPA: CotH kinase family protein, partial [Thermoanaerobaculia bacterium]|nr:CotH kinase family protein [Thermoanaerobaculia bacterium]
REIAAAPAPLTVAWAAKRFDLDLLLDWVAAAMLCETGEPFQAVMVRDNRDALAGGRWSWVLWDLDQSFFDPPRFQRLGHGNGYLDYLSSRRSEGMPAGLLVARLLREDPRFRQLLADRVEHAIDHELTAERARALVARYARMTSTLGNDPSRFAPLLDDYFPRRRESVRAEIAELRGGG